MFKKIILSSTILLGTLGITTLSFPELSLTKAEAAINDAKIQKVKVAGRDYENGTNVPAYMTGSFSMVGDKGVTYTIKQYEFNKVIGTTNVTTKGLSSPVVFPMPITEGNKYEVTYNGRVISTFVIRGH
ncbi:hypothetical protein [Bacillus cereus]|uniref:hypothetical protein n=1 Tax=Bacillus cereus TaxID=1396 RepID=UPI000330691A|nr:hypothetical protein [Bacillus cereus]EOO12528.1 hypothetical protein IG9_05459 [Bacillus cereus HuA2-9]